MTSLLNLNQLRVFHFVAKYGKFSQAAERLMVKSPAFSMNPKAWKGNMKPPLSKRLKKSLR